MRFNSTSQRLRQEAEAKDEADGLEDEELAACTHVNQLKPRRVQQATQKYKKRKGGRANSIPAFLCLTCGSEGTEGAGGSDTAHFEGRHSIG